MDTEGATWFPEKDATPVVQWFLVEIRGHYLNLDRFSPLSLTRRS